MELRHSLTGGAENMGPKKIFRCLQNTKKGTYDCSSMPPAADAETPIDSDNFELDPLMLQLVMSSQYGGTQSENPNLHIRNFLLISDAYTPNEESSEAICFMLFPFSLRDRAKDWFHSLPPDSITTWDELTIQFLREFFPPAVEAKFRSEIFRFCQRDGESLNEAWERFQKLIQRCPRQSLPKRDLVHSFFFGLSEGSRTFITLASRGAFMKMDADGAYSFLERWHCTTTNGQQRKLYTRM